MNDRPALLEQPEERPAAFSGRFARGGRSLASRKHGPTGGRRMAALAAAIAVPAMAAPAEWPGAASEAEAIVAPAELTPMPFEVRGGSFPGSAFYWLEDAPRADYANQERKEGLDPLAHWDGDPTRAVETSEAGPAAARFHLSGSGIDKARALQCLAMAIYYEAASESIAGQRAVAQVVLNRVRHPTYPDSVCGVVFQGSQRRTGCQFSFTCDGSLARRPSRAAWERARDVAQDALSGTVFEPVGMATHYHTTWVNPYWAPSLDHVGTIGAHRFYRWRGAAGRIAAFTARYHGGEPPAAPLPRSLDDAHSQPDPVALARSYAPPPASLAAAAPAADPAARPAPAPDYSAAIEQRGGDRLFTADRLPGAGAVKPEYARSGRWLRQPN